MAGTAAAVLSVSEEGLAVGVKEGIQCFYQGRIMLGISEAAQCI